MIVARRIVAARNATEQIVAVRLAPDLLSDRVVARYTSPTFRFPMSIVKVGGRLLVLNAQLDRLAADRAPDLPFTLVAMPASA